MYLAPIDVTLNNTDADAVGVTAQVLPNKTNTDPYATTSVWDVIQDMENGDPNHWVIPRWWELSDFPDIHIDQDILDTMEDKTGTRGEILSLQILRNQQRGCITQ